MPGFPAAGGVIRDGIAEYVCIKQQPAALQAGIAPRLDELARTLGISHLRQLLSASAAVS